MNGRYLRELALDDLTARLEALTGREGLRGAAAISQEKISTLADFWPLAGFFFDGPADDPEAREKSLGARRRASALAAAREALAERARAVDARRALETALRGVLERSGAKPQAGLPAAPRGARRHDRLTGPSRRSRCSGATRRWPGWTALNGRKGT